MMAQAPGLFTAQIVERYPVFAMPDARFVVSQNTDDWTIGTGVDIRPGMVLLTQPRTVLAVGENQHTICVSRHERPRRQPSAGGA
jgi:hypothetical protein